MPTKEYQESMDRIVRGLELAEREMLEAKAKNDENVIVCQEDGVIRSIPASKFLWIDYANYIVLLKTNMPMGWDNI